MSPANLRRAVAALTLLVAATALAEAQTDRFSAGGYFRIMTRPDFQGGSSKLGLWNLSGRLLNEGPWGALELKLDVLKPNPGTQEVWASIHTKIEGGSFSNADPANGALSAFRVTQMYVRAGNILFDRVTWQLGTLDTYFGDLGLYDVKPAQISSRPSACPPATPPTGSSCWWAWATPATSCAATATTRSSPRAGRCGCAWETTWSSARAASATTSRTSRGTSSARTAPTWTRASATRSTSGTR